MTTTTIANNLEEQLLSSFATPENELGLGKIIYNTYTNESLISNGKSIITYANTQLRETKVVKQEEKTRMTNLVNVLIHHNFGDMIACELYFSKQDVGEILSYIRNNPNNMLDLKFDNKLGVVLVTTNEDKALVKILKSKQINDFKTSNEVSTAETTQIYNVLSLIHQGMSEDEVVGVALQHNQRPILVATHSISACISCVKRD